MHSRFRQTRGRRQAISDASRAQSARGGSKVKASARYAKIVEWSGEDQCFIGSAPGLIIGGCHGDDEQAVFEELCQIVEEVIKLHEEDGRPLPPPTAGRDFVNRMQGVA